MFAKARDVEAIVAAAGGGRQRTWRRTVEAWSYNSAGFGMQSLQIQGCDRSEPHPAPELVEGLHIDHVN